MVICRFLDCPERPQSCRAIDLGSEFGPSAQLMLWQFREWSLCGSDKHILTSRKHPYRHYHRCLLSDSYPHQCTIQEYCDYQLPRDCCHCREYQ